jgi:hypothetical protein
MFYYPPENLYINEGQAFTINDVQYPNNWLNLSTPEEKAAIGLEEVIATNSPASDVYYWVSIELDKASLTYVNTPKDLTTVKSNSLSQINNTAYTILQPSDWMVVKAFETSTPINPDWNTWRASIRATADSTRTAVTAASDVDAVATIMGNIQWAKSPSTVAAEAEANATVTATTTNTTGA